MIMGRRKKKANVWRWRIAIPFKDGGELPLVINSYKQVRPIFNLELAFWIKMLLCLNCERWIWHYVREVQLAELWFKQFSDLRRISDEKDFFKKSSQQPLFKNLNQQFSFVVFGISNFYCIAIFANAWTSSFEVLRNQIFKWINV